MKLTFASSTGRDAADLAALHRAVAEDLARRFPGHRPFPITERGILVLVNKPKFARVLVARAGKRIAGTLHLATKKPWAIDTAYFTRVKTPLYLTGMAVHPDFQRQGVGRTLLQEAVAVTKSWPAHAIRLDAFDSAYGAGPFYAKCGYREMARVKYKGTPLIYFELVFDR